MKDSQTLPSRKMSTSQDERITVTGQTSGRELLFASVLLLWAEGRRSTAQFVSSHPLP